VGNEIISRIKGILLKDIKDKTFFQELISKFKNLEEIKKGFIPLGDKSFELNPSCHSFIHRRNNLESDYFRADFINLELYIRITNIKSLDEEDELEILLNDTSLTKFNENKNAEFMYKSQFLAKVAHEFKNPIITNLELIDQALENLSTNKQIVKGALKEMQAMSNYLLLLVKDLDYFSGNMLERKVELETNEIHILNMMKFCNKVCLCLLNKHGKMDQILFDIHLDENVPKIFYCDEWRLKQVLINLLTNSIKFTTHGEIRLLISREINKDEAGNEVEWIKFLITDTGQGFKQMPCQNTNYFRLNSNASEKSQNGFGLAIVNDITARFGQQIHYSSEIGHGSKFWFSIKLISLPQNSPQKVIIQLENSISSNEDSVKTITKYCMPSKINSKLLASMNESNLMSSISSLDSNTENGKEHLKKRYSNTSLFYNNDRNSDFDIVQGKSNKSIFSHKIDYEVGLKKTLFDDNHSIDIKGYSFNQQRVSPLTEFDSNKILNIILVDDEHFTRQSTNRIINRISKELNININIIQADDGIECLYYLYKSIRIGQKISCILSDETMNYLNGTKCAEVVNSIILSKKISQIPFYIITAYESMCHFSTSSKAADSYIKQVLTKPLTKEVAKKIIKSLLCK
jgi:signal transduction histidine kinase